MGLFIAALLTAAALQSCGKLALLPRRFAVPAALLGALPPWLFEERLARTNLGELNRALCTADTLREYCALVVIQELLVMAAGLSLLAEFESGGRVRWWKYLVFVPSLLFPVGVLYLQLTCFNVLVQWEFRTVTLALSAGVPAVVIAIGEGFRLLRRDRMELALDLFHFEWILLLLALFLPVTAGADRLAGFGSFDWRALPAWGVLLLPVAAGAVFQWIYNRYINRRFDR